MKWVTKMDGLKATAIVGFIACASCAGGGVQNNAGANQNASDALVQMLPYEALRNNLIQSLCLTSSSESINELDTVKVLFGAAPSPGQPRNLSFSIPRVKKHYQICDTACREGIEACPEKLFPDASNQLDPKIIGRRIFGYPPKQEDLDAIADLMKVNGYSSTLDRQHAICVAFCSSLKAQLQ